VRVSRIRRIGRCDERPDVFVGIDVIRIDDAITVVVGRVGHAIVVEIGSEWIAHAGLDDHEVVIGERKADLAREARRLGPERIGLGQVLRDDLRALRRDEAYFLDGNPRRRLHRDLQLVARAWMNRREARAVACELDEHDDAVAGDELAFAQVGVELRGGKIPDRRRRLHPVARPAELAIDHAVRIAVAGPGRDEALREQREPQHATRSSRPSAATVFV